MAVLLSQGPDVGAAIFIEWLHWVDYTLRYVALC